MSPSDKWQWCIHKIIVQQAVARTTKMLITKGLWEPSVVPEEVHEDVVEINVNNLDVHLETKEEEVKKNVMPEGEVAVGRDWDEWLEKEEVLLKGKLVEGKISEETYERRRVLLEKRWSNNI